MKQALLYSFALVLIMACSPKEKSTEPSADQTAPLAAKEILSVSEIFPQDTGSDPFAFPKPLIDSTLLKKILDMVSTGKVMAYKNYSDTVALSKEQVDRLLKTQVDTIMVEGREKGKSEMKIMTSKLIDFISAVQFKEDWVYDDATGNITKRVVGYALCIDAYDESNVKGFKTVFWIKNRY